MGSNTNNLNLYKANPVEDANDTFNIETMLNDNWDKVDDAVGNKVDLQTTQKDNLVGAINEVKEKTTNNEDRVASLEERISKEKTLPFSMTGPISSYPNGTFTKGLFSPEVNAVAHLDNKANNGVDYTNWTVAGAGTKKSANGIHLVADGGSDRAYVTTNLKDNTLYTLIYFVSDSDLDSTFVAVSEVSGIDTALSVNRTLPTTVGLHKATFTTKSTITNNRLWFLCSSVNTDGRYIDFKIYGVYEGDQTNNPNIDIEHAYGLNTCALNYELLSRGKNLFNKTKATIGKRITIDGSIVDDADTYITDYTQVKPYTSYKYNRTDSSYVGFYDYNKRLIKVEAVNPIVTTGETYYIRTYGKTSIVKIDDFMIVEGDNIPTEYIPYYQSKTEFSIPSGYPLVELPNEVKNYIDADGNYHVNVMKHVLQSGDIKALTNGAINQWVRFQVPSDSIAFGLNGADLATAYQLEGFNSKDGTNSADLEENRHTLVYSTTNQYNLVFPFGTYADLAAAQADLVGKTLYYQTDEEKPIEDGQEGFIAPKAVGTWGNGNLVVIPKIDFTKTLNNETTISLNKTMMELEAVYAQTDEDVEPEVLDATLAPDGLSITLTSAYRGNVRVVGVLHDKHCLYPEILGDIPVNICTALAATNAAVSNHQEAFERFKGGVDLNFKDVVNDVDIVSKQADVSGEVFTSTINGTVIEIDTGGKYKQLPGKLAKFKFNTPVTGATGISIDGQATLQIKDNTGELVTDYDANTAYEIWYEDGEPPFFTQAPKGGGIVAKGTGIAEIDVTSFQQYAKGTVGMVLAFHETDEVNITGATSGIPHSVVHLRGDVFVVSYRRTIAGHNQYKNTLFIYDTKSKKIYHSITQGFATSYAKQMTRIDDNRILMFESSTGTSSTSAQIVEIKDDFEVVYHPHLQLGNSSEDETPHVIRPDGRILTLITGDGDLHFTYLTIQPDNTITMTSKVDTSQGDFYSFSELVPTSDPNKFFMFAQKTSTIYQHRIIEIDDANDNVIFYPSGAITGVTAKTMNKNESILMSVEGDINWFYTIYLDGTTLHAVRFSVDLLNNTTTPSNDTAIQSSVSGYLKMGVKIDSNSLYVLYNISTQGERAYIHKYYFKTQSLMFLPDGDEHITNMDGELYYYHISGNVISMAYRTHDENMKDGIKFKQLSTGSSFRVLEEYEPQFREIMNEIHLSTDTVDVNSLSYTRVQWVDDTHYIVGGYYQNDDKFHFFVVGFDKGYQEIISHNSFQGGTSVYFDMCALRDGRYGIFYRDASGWSDARTIDVDLDDYTITFNAVTDVQNNNDSGHACTSFNEKELVLACYDADTTNAVTYIYTVEDDGSLTIKAGRNTCGTCSGGTKLSATKLADDLVVIGFQNGSTIGRVIAIKRNQVLPGLQSYSTSAFDVLNESAQDYNPKVVALDERTVLFTVYNTVLDAYRCVYVFLDDNGALVSKHVTDGQTGINRTFYLTNPVMLGKGRFTSAHTTADSSNRYMHFYEAKSDWTVEGMSTIFLSEQNTKPFDIIDQLPPIRNGKMVIVNDQSKEICTLVEFGRVCNAVTKKDTNHGENVEVTLI